MRSLLFEQPQEDVCVEVGKSLQHQEQDPSQREIWDKDIRRPFRRRWEDLGNFFRFNSKLIYTTKQR